MSLLLPLCKFSSLSPKSAACLGNNLFPSISFVLVEQILFHNIKIENTFINLFFSDLFFGLASKDSSIVYLEGQFLSVCQIFQERIS